MCQIARVSAAESGEYEETAEYHGNGVERVAEEQDELLNESDFNEEKQTFIYNARNERISSLDEKCEL